MTAGQGDRSRTRRRITSAIGMLVLVAAALPAAMLPDHAAAAGLAVDFTCSPSCTVAVGATVTLDATSNAVSPAYYWELTGDQPPNFDDATGSSTQVKFTKAGLYPISVEVVDNSDKTQATAEHDISVQPASTLTVTVSGSGTVKSSPAGIDCPGTCSAPFANGTQVSLNATADPGQEVAWGGDCSGSDKCAVMMDADRSVTATFVYADETNYSDLGQIGGVFTDGSLPGTVTVKRTALHGNRPPKVVLRLPRRVRADHLTTLNASKSKDPDGHILGYRWDLNGDGVYDDGFGSKVQFAFSHTGHDPVSVQAIDNDGRVVTMTRRIRVSAPPALPVNRALTHLPPRQLAGSFSGGLKGWRDLGSPFTPMHSDRVSLGQILDTAGRLGGNYASGLKVPVHATGGWLTSFNGGVRAHGLSTDARGNLGTGMLLSHPFTVNRSYLTYQLGGDASHAQRGEYVEVLVHGANGYRVRKSLTRYALGSQDAMAPVAVPMRGLHGDRVAVAIVDTATTGHIDVDQLRLANLPPAVANTHPTLATPYYEMDPATRASTTAPPAVYGMADYHSHPMGNQGFGALRGIHTYMGSPGADVSSYDTHPGQYDHDQYADDDYHFGGPVAAFLINVMEGRRNPKDLISAALAGSGSIGSWAEHPTRGGDCLHGCAEYHGASLGPAHEQMNIYDIHRAWEGGLRLMSSLAINSTALEYGMGTANPGLANLGGPDPSDRIAITPEAKVIAAQVEGMRQLAADNSSWMGIAYDPQQAYDLIRAGKLAIILGTEIDTTGDLGFASAPAEVDWLWHLGIRQVTPIHCCDSRIGGTAIFQDGYNTANDFIHRPARDVPAPQIAGDVDSQGIGLFPKPGQDPAVGYFIHVQPGCPDPADRGTCIQWRFDQNDGTGSVTNPSGTQSVADIDANCTAAGIGYCIAHPGETEIGVNGYGPASGGEENTKGLTSYGAQYIAALMSRGMLIDMEHMSDKTISDLITPGLPNGTGRGPMWGNNSPCSMTATFNDPHASCWSHAYPLMSSHTSYRAQSLQPSETTFKGFLPREFERTPAQIEYIHRSGGVVGPVITQDPVDTISQHVASAAGPTWQIVDGHDRAVHSNPANNCAGSTASWAQAYLYSVEKMGGHGVGLASDMLLFGGPRPRFGASAPTNGAPYACGDSAEANDRAQEESTNPGQYRRGAQTNPLSYTSDPAQPLLSGTRTIRQERDPSGAYRNFNTQGMVTYGQLPDLIQDAHDIGVSYDDLMPLFQSAQDYVDMWSKAFTIAGCYNGGYAGYDHCSDGDSPASLDEATTCLNTCPNDPGHGLALDPEGRPFGFRTSGTN